MATENLDKKRLDADFQILGSLTPGELERLARDYEILRRDLMREVVDIADRTQMIYRFLGKLRQGGEASVS